MLFFLLLTSKSYAITTKATHAIIFDYDTGDILFEKNANVTTPPASMTKIMTSYIIFDKIKNGNLSLNDKFLVSSKAYKKGGSRMFLEANTRVSVKDLLLGVIVQSGNDASITLAENISGSEEDFAELMNNYAKKLGMKNTNFINSSGWPHPRHYSTMFDLSILSKSMIENFPQLYKYFALKKFSYNNIMQPNRNSLLKYYDGVDGLKTGYVKDSGYGMIVSAVKDYRRIIVAINGLESSKSRIQESEKLLNWAFRETKQVVILENKQSLITADVWLGHAETVQLLSGQKVVSSLTQEQRQNVTLKIKYNNPLIAPLIEYAEYGKIQIIIPEREIQEIPLVAQFPIKKINFVIRVFSAIDYLIFGNEK